MTAMENSSNKYKSGFVAVIGRPNVGKSTLVNALVGQKISITSRKAQTTREKIRGIFTDPDKGQIIFLDTPGMHRAKNRLGEYMAGEAWGAVSDADLIVWMSEPSACMGAEDRAIAMRLGKTKAPVIFLINKTDTVVYQELLPCIDACRKIYDFAEIVPISALKQRDIDKIPDLIFKYLSEGPMFYDEDAFTDQTELKRASELIREKALLFLQKEVPHGIAVVTESMKLRDDKNIIDIYASIICEKESHKGIIIGRGGALLKRIGSEARRDMEKIFGRRVNLKLRVKVRTRWQESESMIKNMGYIKH